VSQNDTVFVLPGVVARLLDWLCTPCTVRLPHPAVTVQSLTTNNDFNFAADDVPTAQTHQHA
jgi:hypothetical protein